MIRSDIPQAPITKDFIGSFLPASPIIIEAGAHIGRDTVKMALLWPNAQIYAFEPVPNLYKELKENTKDLPNVHCFQIALSDSIGTALLHVSSGASTAASSLFEPLKYREDRPNVLFHPMEVSTITLDQWVNEHTLNHIDFLWLDMQGTELRALKASPVIFSTVKALLIEASLVERFKENPLYDEILEWLEGKGFTALRQDVPKHNKINIFFIRKN